MKKYLETNENGNTAYRNIWDAAEAVLRGKFSRRHRHGEKSNVELAALHVFFFISV